MDYYYMLWWTIDYRFAPGRNPHRDNPSAEVEQEDPDNPHRRLSPYWERIGDTTDDGAVITSCRWDRFYGPVPERKVSDE